MLVTIYTDASYKEGKGGGAAWIKSDNGTIKMSKAYSAKDVFDAEAKIVYIAIRHVLKIWKETEVIFVNTDNLELCKYMWDFIDKVPKTEYKKKVVSELKKLCTNAGAKYRFKHVKGHQDSDNGIRAWLNNWCDKKAGKKRKTKTINKKR